MKNMILNFPTRPWRSGNISLPTAAIAMLAIVLAAPTAVRAAPLPGAIFTTDSTCSGVDLNIYGSKADVYIDGGPAHPGAASLPDGSYYVKVTAPDGTLLGTSVGSGNDTPFVVLNHEPASCYQLAAILIKASDSTPGYDDTPNDGGEYKVWVSTVAAFDNDSTKTDNFKVREGGGGPGDTANLCVDKFYDTNVNGQWDTNEQEITGWQFTVFGTVGFDTMQVPHTDTPWCSVVDPDTFHVTEADALAPPTWLHTTDPVVSITIVAGQNGEVDFGNVCLGGGTGALTLGFWSNKNGQNLEIAADFTALNGLCLRTALGGDQDFLGSLGANKTALNAFLLGANATNMANMLSAQLAAMKLNVLHGKVSASAIVACPCGDMGLNNQFITIGHLMTAANNALCADGYTPAGDPNRATQECLKTALDNANNNQNFVQSSPATCGTPRFPSN
jgi:hypothetical protein